MGFTHHRWCWLAAISRTSSADASLFRTRTTTIPGARHILQPPSSFSRAHFIKFSSIVHQSSTLSRLCFRHFIYNSLTTIWHYFHIHLLPDHQVEDLCQDACTAATFNGTEMLLTVSQFYPARLLLSRALTLPFFFCCRPKTLVSLSMYRDCARCFHDDYRNTFCSHVCHMVSLLVVFLKMCFT